MNVHHQELLNAIKSQSGKPTQHTFLNNYLGSNHPRYPISNPVLRTIARNWIREHKHLGSEEIVLLLTSLIEGKSFTEKCLAGILLDYCNEEQRSFNPAYFQKWLTHLEGWAELDTLCTGRYEETEIVRQWDKWKPLLLKFSRSKNIHIRRASIVLLCSPLRKCDEPALTEVAFENIQRLKAEKEVLITKAISWVLRSMVKHHRRALEKFIKEEKNLPAIAIREVNRVLTTGRKSAKK
jgi:3-methyladenine DNA glycosylase AlkD